MNSQFGSSFASSFGDRERVRLIVARQHEGRRPGVGKRPASVEASADSGQGAHETCCDMAEAAPAMRRPMLCSPGSLAVAGQALGSSSAR